MYKSLKTLIYIFLVTSILYSQRENEVFKYLDPLKVDMNQIHLQQIDDLIKERIAKGEVAGTVALVIKDQSIVYEKAFGFADIDKQKKMEKNTIFTLASMSKLMTTVGALILYDKGMFFMDTELGDILPEFSNPDIFVSYNKNNGKIKTRKATEPILMKHLFTHTSGIPYPIFADDNFGRDVYLKSGVQSAFPDFSITLEENIKKLSKLPLFHEPGETFTYGLNMDVLGRVIEVLDGRPFSKFMEDELFGPLKLEATGFGIDSSQWDRIASIYSYGEKGELILFKDLQDFPDSDQNELIKYPHLRFNHEHYKNDVNKIAMGGTDIMSTAYDYGKFLQMILNDGNMYGKQIISKKTARMIYKPLEVFYGGEFVTGLGVTVAQNEETSYSRVSNGTFGWGGYFFTECWADPEENMIGILMNQIAPAKDESFYNYFQHLVYSSLMTED